VEALPDDTQIVVASDGEAAVRAESRRLRSYHRGTRCRRGPSVLSVKQPTVHTDRSRAQIPSAMRPWTPPHSGLQRDKVTHDGTQKTARQPRESAGHGREQATATDGTGGSGYADRQLHYSSTEPKRVLCGQTRILDFARYDPVATQNEICDGHGDAAFWQFRSVPHPVKARYYNLRCQADLDEQRCVLTFRLMRQEQGASSIKN
jgi:hypothetical protein